DRDRHADRRRRPFRSAEVPSRRRRRRGARARDRHPAQRSRRRKDRKGCLTPNSWEQAAWYGSCKLPVITIGGAMADPNHPDKATERGPAEARDADEPEVFEADVANADLDLDPGGVDLDTEETDETSPAAAR